MSAFEKQFPRPINFRTNRVARGLQKARQEGWIAALEWVQTLKFINFATIHDCLKEIKANQ